MNPRSWGPYTLCCYNPYQGMWTTNPLRVHVVLKVFDVLGSGSDVSQTSPSHILVQGHADLTERRFPVADLSST